MTDETRETLTSELETVEKAVMSYPLAVANARLAAALRDVLTPRTCATCRHAKFYTTNSEYGMCRGDSIAIGRDITESDGCICGWQAREGEGGGHV